MGDVETQLIYKYLAFLHRANKKKNETHPFFLTGVHVDVNALSHDLDRGLLALALAGQDLELQLGSAHALVVGDHRVQSDHLRVVGAPEAANSAQVSLDATKRSHLRCHLVSESPITAVVTKWL